MIWPFLCFAVAAAYGLSILRCWLAWNRLPGLDVSSTPKSYTSFSVVIAVRNEAHNILNLLQDLEQQEYPSSKFEVIVVDDHSEDNTAALVQEFSEQSRINISLLPLSSFPGKRQKKAAIEAGISKAKGDWIVLTDGDCRVTPKWISAYNQCQHLHKVRLISGPVLLSPAKGIFQHLQTLEFSSLIGVGAASIAMQRPTMCNGANIAYEKAAFYAVNGFTGNEHVASGDDEFLLHKIHQHFPGQVAFLKAPEAIVQTSPCITLKSFLQQRIRWASKWKHYQVSHAQSLALLVVGANVSVLVAMAMLFLGEWSWWIFSATVLAKLLPDCLFLYQVLGFFQKKRLLALMGLLQLVYVPYILLSGLLGLKGTYHWKNRQL